MKKSTAATLIILFVCIPLTLWLGTQLTGRGYYLTGTLIVIELLIPFFLAFEGRKPQARELVTIAVLCALAVAGRVAIPLPNFKLIFGIVMIAGIAFGPQSGFLVGAVSAFASNFFYGQGPFMPWQMLGYGVAGLLAGYAFRDKWLPRKPWAMAVFGFAAVLFIVGPILDTSGVFLYLPVVTPKSVFALYVSGFLTNISHAVATLLTMLLLGKPLLDKLDRLKVKYGMMEGQEHGL